MILTTPIYFFMLIYACAHLYIVTIRLWLNLICNPNLITHSNQTESNKVIWSRVSKGRDVPGQTGTGRPVVPLSRDKKVSLSRCPFVPGQEHFPCPVVPLSRDKGRSKCPGTKPSVPGRPAGQNGQKNGQKNFFLNFFLFFFIFFFWIFTLKTA